MSAFEAIKKRLFNTFIHLNDVFQIETRNDFSITDFEGQSYLILESDETHFTVQINNELKTFEGFDENKIFVVKNSKKIGFIPIDGKKGLLGYGDSYCDFLFFDENDFCFIEFKLNSISTEPRAVRKNRKKAVNQLSNTIDFFDNQLYKHYDGLNLEAYICTPETYPRNDTAWMAIEVAFLEKYGIPLFEKRDKICK
jgi:hypothetical protein